LLTECKGFVFLIIKVFVILQVQLLVEILIGVKLKVDNIQEQEVKVEIILELK